MTKSRNIGRGGARAGAGRKRISDPLSTYALRVSARQAALLKLWGGGDASAGLRWLVDAVEHLVVRGKAGSRLVKKTGNEYHFID
jgi:hypothetical protein